MPDSDIRVDIRWRDPVVFAGEDLECIISFRYIARTNLQQERGAARSRQSTRHNSVHSDLDKGRTISQSTAFTKPGRRPSFAEETTYSQAHGRRHTLSRDLEPKTPESNNLSTFPAVTPRPTNAHGRSLSILSLGTERGAGIAVGSKARSARPAGHSRATSLQTISQHGRQPSGEQIPTTANGAHATRQTHTNGRVPKQAVTMESSRGPISADFKFPAPEQKQDDPGTPPLVRDEMVRSKKSSQLISPISSGNTSGIPVSLNPVARVLSETSVDGTSRTSGDFYAASAISEQAASWDPPPVPLMHTPASLSILPQRGASSRQVSSRPLAPEHLMMGHVQTIGSFSVDGSLINQAPFEDVKRRGVVSTQAGGGVVGVERSKRESGLFGAFGWANIGESLTGLLGMDDMSSVREMRNVASTKTIPLLSTPQTILFVDLKLSAGQRRSYSYKFRLPKGLPPSHRGRSIKVTYHLRIAVQRSGRGEAQHIKDVEVPFRVLSSVDRFGGILGHDLMSPYVLLQDVARSEQIADEVDPSTVFGPRQMADDVGAKSGGLDDFLLYAQRLLAERPEGAPLLSPSMTREGRRFSEGTPQPRSMNECIDLAIMRSNHRSTTTDTDQSDSRFTIARAGRYVGVLSMLRSSYRSGEVVLVKLDFSPPHVDAGVAGASQAADTLKAYVVVVTLETTEKVDPSLALRSPASIVRVTRKIHASVTDAVLFANHACFALEIPTAASPTFDTTGVSLEWRVRVEFTTSALPPKRDSSSIIPKGGRLGPLEQSGGDSESGGIEVEDSDGTTSDDETTGLDTARSPETRNGSPAEELKGEKQLLAVAKAAPASHPRREGSEAWLTADGMLETVSEDERGRILVAREVLTAETFEVAVPIRVYGSQPAVGPAGVRSEVYEI